jgi:hypothetical protein
MSITINNIDELAEAIGVIEPDRIARTIYKFTECGCVLDYAEDGVLVAGYAEGSHTELPSHPLLFPFTMSEFWTTVEDADSEGCEEWEKANTSPCYSCEEFTPHDEMYFDDEDGAVRCGTCHYMEREDNE